MVGGWVPCVFGTDSPALAHPAGECTWRSKIVQADRLRSLCGEAMRDSEVGKPQQVFTAGRISRGLRQQTAAWILRNQSTKAQAACKQCQTERARAKGALWIDVEPAVNEHIATDSGAKVMLQTCTRQGMGNHP